jgi:DNA-binding response OmpR family regulator
MPAQDSKLLIIAEGSEGINELHSGLVQRGFACEVTSANGESNKKIVEQTPDLVVMAMNGHSTSSRIRKLSQEIRREWQLPIVVLVNKDDLTLDRFNMNSRLIADFVVKPIDLDELVLRIKRLLQRKNDTTTGEIIECGDLLIDLAQCEVSVSGRLVGLTFKEYELLRFLASNPGRVFMRDKLLNEVWGYDYFGGDRTVDVHIRRLRSKIEDANHTFIETVRNIGYRFRGGAQ